jgi:SET domain-containing protein
MAQTKRMTQGRPVVRRVIDYALDRDFTRVGKSRIAGKGVFAKRKIPRGARIIEYKGKRRPKVDVLLDQAERPNVYVFNLHDDVVIDASKGGNDARFINHSCEPNCETLGFGEKIFVYAIRDIVRGEELTFDYQLQSIIPDRKAAARNVCLCRSPKCKGTMFALKRRSAR